MRFDANVAFKSQTSFQKTVGGQTDTVAAFAKAAVYGADKTDAAGKTRDAVVDGRTESAFTFLRLNVRIPGGQKFQYIQVIQGRHGGASKRHGLNKTDIGWETAGHLSESKIIGDGYKPIHDYTVNFHGDSQPGGTADGI